MTDLSLDAEVRAFVYEAALARGRPPLRAEITSALGRPATEIERALARLHDGHILVLQPGSGEILMANPFSAVPTPFEVATEKHTSFGNCVWDGLGILAILRADGAVRTACACCGEALELRVRGGLLQAVDAVVHFAVPAKRWWDDVAFT